MSLIQPLPDGPLDIVGDIHGEVDALRHLLQHLGYNQQGEHPEGRTLVFVGDFCDRGPDSPAVLALARQLVQSGRALAVLGNHEINLLREDPKDGSGWFFDARLARDQERYAPFSRPTATERSEIGEFLSGLPIGLERPDLRVIHAAWQEPQIGAIRPLPLGSVRAEYDQWETLGQEEARRNRLADRMAAELLEWPHGLENNEHRPPFLQAHGEYEASKQMFNPLKVLTSGVEAMGTSTFFAGGKWRFVQRVPWWNTYTDSTPVVIGHYWRRLRPPETGARGNELFEHTSPLAWHGARGNVFCVDYSVGGRWTARKKGTPVGTEFKLAALRWPERVLQLDDGSSFETENFGQPASLPSI